MEKINSGLAVGEEVLKIITNSIEVI